jgi:hypothetical protein
MLCCDSWGGGGGGEGGVSSVSVAQPTRRGLCKGDAYSTAQEADPLVIDGAANRDLKGQSHETNPTKL